VLKEGRTAGADTYSDTGVQTAKETRTPKLEKLSRAEDEKTLAWRGGFYKGIWGRKKPSWGEKGPRGLAWKFRQGRGWGNGKLGGGEGRNKYLVTAKGNLTSSRRVA